MLHFKMYADSQLTASCDAVYHPYLYAYTPTPPARALTHISPHLLTAYNNILTLQHLHKTSGHIHAAGNFE